MYTSYTGKIGFLSIPGYSQFTYPHTLSLQFSEYELYICTVVHNKPGINPAFFFYDHIFNIKWFIPKCKVYLCNMYYFVCTLLHHTECLPKALNILLMYQKKRKKEWLI